jgi:hypothetical protein
VTAEDMRELVRASRRAQGFSGTVTDPRFLVDLAAAVVDHDAVTQELPVIGGGRDEAA